MMKKEEIRIGATVTYKEKNYLIFDFNGDDVQLISPSGSICKDIGRIKSIEVNYQIADITQQAFKHFGNLFKITIEEVENFDCGIFTKLVTDCLRNGFESDKLDAISFYDFIEDIRVSYRQEVETSGDITDYLNPDYPECVVSFNKVYYWLDRMEKILVPFNKIGEIHFVDNTEM